MAVVKSEVQSSAAVTSGTTVLNGLTAGWYAATGSINHSTNDPLDVLIDVTFTTNTTTASTGNKQVIVFCQASPDGTNFTSGPTTSNDTTNEANLYFVGVIPAASANTAYRKLFSLAAAYGGTLPLYSRIIFKNETGNTLAAVASAVTAAEVWGVAL